MVFIRWIVAHRGTFDAQTNLARREIVAGILSGMRFIHDHGYIHCDLKVSTAPVALSPLRAKLFKLEA